MKWKWIPIRVEICLLAMLGSINLYITRVNLSVISVAMVKKPSSNLTYEENLPQCLRKEQYGSNYVELHTNKTEEPIHNYDQDDALDWSEVQRGLALGCFYYGYATTQIIGGRLSELYGTKVVLGFSIFAGGVCTMLAPCIAKMSFEGFIALRIIHGMFQGPAFPSLFSLSTRWIPPLERSRFVSNVCLSTSLGVIIALPICGVIIPRYGWDMAFYITGSFSILWTVLWGILAYDSPDAHPRISKEEKEYIKQALKDGGTDSEETRNNSVPWKEILTSKPCWAIIIGELGNVWGLRLFLSQLPAYFKNVLGLSIANTGFLSSLPFLMRYLGAISFSYLADTLMEKGVMTVYMTRGIFSLIAMFGPAMMMFGVTFANCNYVAVLVYVCLALFMNGAVTSSILVNCTDLSPVFSATIAGIDNSAASIISFLPPVITGLIINEENTIENWRITFLMSVPIYFFCEFYFLKFYSTTIQPWNKVPTSEELENAKK